MPTLIKDGKVADNTWQLIAKDLELEATLNTNGEQLLVPLTMWQEHKIALQESGKQIGVWLDSDDDPYELANDAADLPLVAVNFPVFRDGRSFSSAAILRERLSYKNELRAIGDVLRDQLFYMKKCGINSFELPESINAEQALHAFEDFADNYQSTVENPAPLFRRR